MKLVKDAKEAWKWFSMQSMGLAIALQTAWATMPADLKAGVSDTVIFYITIVILIAGVVGRLVDQGAKE